MIDHQLNIDEHLILLCKRDGIKLSALAIAIRLASKLFKLTKPKVKEKFS